MIAYFMEVFYYINWRTFLTTATSVIIFYTGGDSNNLKFHFDLSYSATFTSSCRSLKQYNPAENFVLDEEQFLTVWETVNFLKAQIQCSFFMFSSVLLLNTISVATIHRDYLLACLISIFIEERPNTL